MVKVGSGDFDNELLGKKGGVNIPKFFAICPEDSDDEPVVQVEVGTASTSMRSTSSWRRRS
jgi:hypothetical protein